MVTILLGIGLQSCDREENNGDNNSSVKWVDLGLPSGLLWADRNLGASNPEDYGNYYAWGETAPKDVYDWSTYAYGNDYYQLTKYCNKSDYGLNGFTDNLSTLDALDDAATVHLGNKARTPTKYEWQELIDNTTSTWITQNEVYGRLFTASNGKSIFLPSSGLRYGSSLISVGEEGFYWSRSLVTVNPDGAWGFYFNNYGRDVDYGFYRDRGLAVRAVRASQH